jgi:DNA polymerase-3 subunit epsilon
MKLNLQKPLVIFDVETTGLDLVKDRVIQLSYIKVFPDGKEVRGDELINP